MPNQNNYWFSKKKFLIFLLILAIISSLSVYFYFQKESKEKETKQVKIILTELNKAINLMDSVKDEMPRELGSYAIYVD